LRSVSERRRIPRLFSDCQLWTIGNRSGIARWRGLFSLQIALEGPQRAHIDRIMPKNGGSPHLQAPNFADSATFSTWARNPPGISGGTRSGERPGHAPVTDITGSEHNDRETHHPGHFVGDHKVMGSELIHRSRCIGHGVHQQRRRPAVFGRALLIS